MSKGCHDHYAPLVSRPAHLTAAGARLWRTLDELHATPEDEARLCNEFPAWAQQLGSPVGRRRFLQLMGASLALANSAGCLRQPVEKIVPYVKPPEQVVPGKSLFFATAMPQDQGVALGLLVESQMGRPIKVEGNAEHPASLGATNAAAQAAVLGLYDPYRSQVVTRDGDVSTWDLFGGALREAIKQRGGERGRAIRVLTEPTTSPTFIAQMEEAARQYPEMRWTQFSPTGSEAAWEASRLALGAEHHVYYRFDRAKTIVSLDSDFLCSGPAGVRYARDFASLRRPGGEAMSRLYAVESTPGNTGAAADHRLSLAPSQMEAFVLALAQALELPLGDLQTVSLSETLTRWIAAAAADLKEHRGASLVVAGPEQSAAVQALALAMNQSLGNFGKTVILTAPLHSRAEANRATLAELVDDLRQDRVGVLLILGGNPVYDAPADYQFAKHLARAPFRAHLSLYEDETSAVCEWHLPAAHFLESWGDARAFDGAASVIQPLIAPLYEGRTELETISALLGRPGQKSYELLRAYWQAKHPDDFETYWQQSVHDGVLADTAFDAASASLADDFAAKLAGQLRLPEVGADRGGEFEVVFRADPTIGDGRYATNGWLQELPKPMTRLTWDNAFFIAPSTARELNLEDEDVIELALAGRKVTGPVFRLPGQPAGVVTLHLGYGRENVAIQGDQRGINAYAVRTSAAPWHASGATIKKLGGKYRLAVTQGHQRMAGRELVRAASLAEFRERPDFAKRPHEIPANDDTLMPDWRYEVYAWGMSVDLNACVGCGGCVVACQAENNIPVVGKEQVAREREMHWLRIDRYWAGEDEDDPSATYFQPVMCMHCEHAPCELVCPVEATTHSAEGLNDMVYNRCVGTRYCANNCPYKVRRFNFLEYNDWETPVFKLLRNPDVTVRSRGVMEKCTYCVQRINEGKIGAELDGRKVRDGEIKTACQAACPTGAIVFGDINDRDSLVTRLKASPLNYGLLTELNTRPRTTYLAVVKNPNPALAEDSGQEAHA